MNEAEARRRFGAAPVGRLATITPSGRPHLVSVTFAGAGTTICSAVDAKPKRSRDLARLRHIAGNPAVSVLVDHYDDDWERLWWVRADGTAQVVHEGQELEDALDRLAGKYAPYRARRPAGPAVIITVGRWTHWAALS